MFEPPAVTFRKTSLVDYPGKVASVLFFPGCNFRCPWCHNRELVLGGAEGLVPLGSCLEEIGRRRALIQGVVLSGGEPLLRGDIGEVVRRAREFGLFVKLDTNGSWPKGLAALCENAATRPDFVALDLKTRPALYVRLTGGKGTGAAAVAARAAATRTMAAPAGPATGTESDATASADILPDVFARIRRSVNILETSGIAYELRSVAVPEFFDESALRELALFVPAAAAWRFMPFAPGNCLDPAWNDRAPTAAQELRALVGLARSLGKNAFEG